jgi:hypothetical protein
MTALDVPDRRMGDRDGMGRPPRPDFAAAAETLGVSEADLKAALGVPETPPERDEMGHPIGGRPPRPDFAAAAEQLGVSEEALLEALHPDGHRGGQGCQNDDGEDGQED